MPTTPPTTRPSSPSTTAPGQKLDLFYQDAASYDPAAKWKVWQLRTDPGPGTSFVFPLPIPQSAIPHPKFLLFQASSSLQDSSGDGLSDAYKTLVLGLDPAVFTPTPTNAPQLTRQVWWNLPGTTVAHLTWTPRMLAAGFSGWELWEFHDQKPSASHVRVYNSYLLPEEAAPEQLADLVLRVKRSGAGAVKFNVGKNPDAPARAVPVLLDLEEQIPAVDLLCECHPFLDRGGGFGS